MKICDVITLPENGGIKIMCYGKGFYTMNWEFHSVFHSVFSEGGCGLGFFFNVIK